MGLSGQSLDKYDEINRPVPTGLLYILTQLAMFRQHSLVIIKATKATFKQPWVPTGKLDVHSIICALFSKLLAMWVKLLKL